MTSLIEPICEMYDPDAVFQHFRVVEFPMSIVGLSTSQKLDLEVNFNKFAYLRTVCEGKLMNFENAREISASHRAFTLAPVSNHVLDITFKPTIECISRAVRQKKHMGNRFVFDLRLIKTHGIFCCNDESHAEIGRYYISGQYEYHKIVHNPKVINFEELGLNEKATRYIRIRNQSKVMAVKMNSIKSAGFTVSPLVFTISPNSSKRIEVTYRPDSLVIAKKLIFNIRNPHEEVEVSDNYLNYSITVEARIICKQKPKKLVVKSLHNIYEPQAYCTFLGEELKRNEKRKEIALKQLQDAKIIKPKITEKNSCKRQKCYSNTTLQAPRIDGRDFCKIIKSTISNEKLFDVFCAPTIIDFGRVSLYTYGEHELVIENKTKLDVILQLSCDHFVVYTDDRLKKLQLNLTPLSTTVVNILCYGGLEGNFEGTFLYTIDNKYERRHPYILDVGNPELVIADSILKFGMVTSEAFITSLSIKIINTYNVDIDFKWAELNSETPFEVKPISGTVPKHKCKFCDITYICKHTKTKVHEIQCQSKGLRTKTIPVELNVMSRKLSIKFLEPIIYFKDIALNMECTQKARMENSSREIALFYVLVEPLLPGVTITPTSGIICPKMIITFDIIVKIPCVLDFNFEVVVKINNKENVILALSGNVVEPKLTTHPKYVLLPRVPCGMIAYIPVIFQNTGPVKLLVEVMETDDENIFGVYTAQGYDKEKILEFYVEGSQSKTVFIKVYDVFRREYDMYIPFKINRLIGPPTDHPCSTELRYYVGPYEEQYQNNIKVRLKSINKDITHFRIAGVITVPWILLSKEKFEIQYEPNGNNCVDFTMTNISRYILFVTISTSKLLPNFSLVCLNCNELESTFSETIIRFELGRNVTASFRALFHPKTHGRFVAVALLYLDRACSLPYYNLTFDGRRLIPTLTTSKYQIIFPPSLLNMEMSQTVTLKMEGRSEIDSFNCSAKEEPNISVSFIEIETQEVSETIYTIVTVLIKVNCTLKYSRHITLGFHHECGSYAQVDVIFCYTHCLLTLHMQPYVSQEENPYPFYPLSEQQELYEYMETCINFLEKWMFMQGFRRDLHPKIPDTFYAISTVSANSMKSKGINVSFLNFFRRIAGPFTKYLHKVSIDINDEALKCIIEVHGTYKQIIHLLRARGTNLPMLRARFLLSYDQFVQYSANYPPSTHPDAQFIQDLISNPQLFDRLGKQTWFDFILQCYKVFVLDSCFFECVCVASQPRNIVNIIIQWYNEHIHIQHKFLRGSEPVKKVTNITTDLSDGIAIISVFVAYCPFLISHFSQFCEINTSNPEEGIVHNACLILEAMSQIKIFFPLSAKDFFKPNFLHMLFLSVHLNVTLPMYESKETIEFLPPLLKSSSRQLTISPLGQESLSFNYQILNNTKNNFSVEKAAPPPEGNEKKNYLNVKFTARFVHKEKAVLLIHGYNKTRLFDTYMIFNLVGYISCLNPTQKVKISNSMYRPNKTDILVCSPFPGNVVFELHLTDIEPTIPVTIPNDTKKEFYVRRLTLVEKYVTLAGYVKDNQDILEGKVYLIMTCLSSQPANHWIWFLSEAGQFFMRVTTQPRWDMAVDSLTIKVRPINPCSCGEECECYRTAVVTLPHRNDFMLKALRFALSEHASDSMLEIYDELIESTTGQIILSMLFFEGGTNMSELLHILRKENIYRITSRNLLTRLDRITLQQHSAANFTLPVTIPASDKSEKYTIMLTSECGMDIRVYRIFIVEEADVE